MLWLVIGLSLVGFGIAAAGIIMSRRESVQVEERLGIKGRTVDKPVEAERRTPLGDAFNQALRSRGIGDNLATQLARANLKLTVGEFVALTTIIVVGGAGAAYVLSGGDIIIIAGVCLVGLFGPRIYVNVLQGRRLNAFNDQLGDTINLMVNGIRAGYSILQAMEAVSEEMSPPISEEFGRVVREVQLGIPMEEALDHMLRRVPSEDLDLMITAINVQREVGGNLAEVLEAISFTIRERIRIKGEIKALTAQSRISGYMVAMVPVALAVVMYFINREFMILLFESTCGHIMIGAAVLGIAAGFFVISKVMDIEV
jgi:tight adherence protein B